MKELPRLPWTIFFLSHICKAFSGDEHEERVTNLLSPHSQACAANKFLYRLACRARYHIAMRILKKHGHHTFRPAGIDRRGTAYYFFISLGIIFPITYFARHEGFLAWAGQFSAVLALCQLIIHYQKTIDKKYL